MTNLCNMKKSVIKERTGRITNYCHVTQQKFVYLYKSVFVIIYSNILQLIYIDNTLPFSPPNFPINASFILHKHNLKTIDRLALNI